MHTRARWLARLLTTVSFALLAAAWMVLGPTQFGGTATYVIVNGNSMEPLYHRGDLVILRERPSYAIGDIVTYRHPQIGPVIHRIIGRDGPRYVFKGDHNTFIDPYEPTRAELIGKAWIYLPSVGKTLTQLREPRNMALLAGAGGLILIGPMTKKDDPRRKRKRHAPSAIRAALPSRQSYTSLLGAFAFLAIASLALAGLAFTRPPTRDTSDEIAYHHTGVFGYSAAAPAGVYDTSTVQTGEPLFPQLTSRATFTFDYRLEADQPADVHGTYRLLAEVQASNGWKRTIELQPSTSFSGGAFGASGALDFANIQALTSSFEQQTGITRAQYTLAIVPEVSVEGALGGAGLTDTFVPRLEFQLDKAQIQLSRDANKDPVRPTQDGVVKATRVQPNSIALPLLKLDVTLARWIALAGLGIGLVGALPLGVLALRAPRPDPSGKIAARYHALLVDVDRISIPSDTRVVGLANIDDLAKIADRAGQLIAHEAHGSQHRYYVHDGNLVYQLQLNICATNTTPSPTALEAMPEATIGTDWQAIFLKELREHGIVSEACHAAGITVAAAYEERARAPLFARAWSAARACWRDNCTHEGKRQ